MDADYLARRIEDELRYNNPLDSPAFTICHVPLAIRDIDPKAYEPQIISIGPYHHPIPHKSYDLEKMETYKWVYFKDFLSRSSESSTHSVADYVRIALDCRRELRSCYSEEVSLDIEDFNRMMVLDACFLIELFLRGNIFVEGSGRHAEEQREDPIYCSAKVYQRVCRDLLLLENQIPFFILIKIYDTYLGSSSRRSAESQLVNIASKYFIHHMKIDQRATQVLPPDNEIWHLLHLVYLLHKPPSTEEEEVCVTIGNTRPSLGIQPLALPPPPSMLLHPVTRLHEAGIKFQRRNEVNFPEISFENGVLKIPHLFIGWSTNSFIRNLLAFELCLPRVQAYFTPYMVFMDHLINTPKDVEILCKNEIIRHELGYDEDVVRLFNEMGQGIVVGNDDNYLTKASGEVNEYCRRKRPVLVILRQKIPKWLAILRFSYFGNPWLVVSFIAAVVLLGCTVLQSVCSVVSCHK